MGSVEGHVTIGWGQNVSIFLVERYVLKIKGEIHMFLWERGVFVKHTLASPLRFAPIPNKIDETAVLKIH